MITDVTAETVTEVPVEGLPEQETSSNTPAPLGGAERSWRDELPEELRGNANLDKYTSVESLAKGYLNASSMLGKDKIIKPNSEDEWNAFYNEMGRPEGADGYEFGPIETPDGYTIDNEMVNEFRNAAHGAGLSTDQAKKLYDWYTANNVAQFENMIQTAEQELVDSEQAMRKEWGNAYEQKMQTALRAVRDFGGDSLVEELNATGLGNNAALIKAFAAIGEKVSGDTTLEGASDGALTPQQIKEEIAAIQNDPGFYDADNLERPAMVKKMQRLMEDLHGTATVGGYSVGN